jgi:hypothetical protein
MASTYSDLKIELIGVGEQSNSWGTTTNVNLGTAIEEAITGSADVTFSGSDVTLTLSDSNSSQSARNLRLNLTGTSGGASRQLILGSGCQINKLYLINNGLDQDVLVKNTTGTGITVLAGKSMFVFNNGTNVVDPESQVNELDNTLVTTSKEAVSISATAATGNIDFNAYDQSVLYYTSDSSGDWNLNIRGNSSKTLNSMLSTGQSVTVAFLVTQGATAYDQSSLKIDGTVVTPKWQGGASTGTASSVDAYVTTVIKTGDATFTALEAVTPFI